jgi:hypothetical protein
VRGLACSSEATFATLRVRVKIMGPGKYENVGKSQSVFIMIDPIISPRTRASGLRPLPNVRPLHMRVLRSTSGAIELTVPNKFAGSYRLVCGDCALSISGSVRLSYLSFFRSSVHAHAREVAHGLMGDDGIDIIAGGNGDLRGVS